MGRARSAATVAACDQIEASLHEGRGVYTTNEVRALHPQLSYGDVYRFLRMLCRDGCVVRIGGGRDAGGRGGEPMVWGAARRLTEVDGVE